jgi:hypothetical protein
MPSGRLQRLERHEEPGTREPQIWKKRLHSLGQLLGPLPTALRKSRRGKGKRLLQPSDLLIQGPPVTIRSIQFGQLLRHRLRGLKDLLKLGPILSLEAVKGIEAPSDGLGTGRIHLHPGGIVPERATHLGGLQVRELQLVGPFSEGAIMTGQAAEAVSSLGQPLGQRPISSIEGLVEGAALSEKLLGMVRTPKLLFQGALLTRLGLDRLDLLQLESQKVCPGFQLPSASIASFPIPFGGL